MGHDPGQPGDAGDGVQSCQMPRVKVAAPSVEVGKVWSWGVVRLTDLDRVWRMAWFREAEETL